MSPEVAAADVTLTSEQLVGVGGAMRQLNDVLHEAIMHVVHYCVPAEQALECMGYEAAAFPPSALATLRREEFIARTRERAYGVRHRVAHRKAEQLLGLYLTELQMKDWKRSSAFRATTRDGQREYEISAASAHNVRVTRMDSPPVALNDVTGAQLCVGARLCAVLYSDEELPMADHVLAQTMMLTGSSESEALFIRTANISRPPVPRVDPGPREVTVRVTFNEEAARLRLVEEQHQRHAEVERQESLLRRRFLRHRDRL